MNKRVLSYFLTGILSLTIVCGCINYTATGIVESAPTKVVEKDCDKQHVYEYVDFRNPVTNISESNSVSVPTNPATEYHDVEYPIIFYSAYEVAYNSEYKIPRWVKYELAQSETDGPIQGKVLNSVRIHQQMSHRQMIMIIEILDGLKDIWHQPVTSSGVVRP